MNPAQRLARKPKDELAGDSRERYNQLKASERGARAKVIGGWVTSGHESGEQAASYLDTWQRTRDAGSAQTPAAALAKLAKDREAAVRQAVAANPNTPLAALTELAADADPEVRRAAAGHPAIPLGAYATWCDLSADRDARVRESAWRSFVAQSAADASLARKALAFARRAGSPAYAMQALAMHANRDVRCALARNRSAPAEVLDSLAQDAEASVRAEVAANPGRPAAILARLAADPDAHVRRAVASENATPAAALERLARDTDSKVRLALASNPAATARLLDRLAGDTAAGVRRAVALNSGAPAALLTRLAADRAAKVRHGAATNRNVPAAALARLAQDEETIVRQQVAVHPDAPLDILRRLAADPDARVRRYAPALLRYSHALSKYTSLPEAAIREMEARARQSGAADEASLARLTQEGINRDSGDFNRAVNPFVDRLLAPAPAGFDRLAVARRCGASRSTLDPQREVASPLLARFAANHAKLPDASFGLEYEMFVAGMRDRSREEVNRLRQALQAEMFGFEDDLSLAAEANIAVAIEMISNVLRSPADIRKLQNVCSILNDFGAFSNNTSGVHVHIGVDHWKTGHLHLSGKRKESAAGSRLAAWDVVSDPRQPSPLQLLFMKQVALDLASIEEEFFRVARESRHSRRNLRGPLADFARSVSGARTKEELARAVQDDDRNHNVNVLAYEKHGTLEIRGFSKACGNSMLVDPNLPVRDLLLMQEVQMKALASIAALLESGAAPGDVRQLAPSRGLKPIVDGYVQDTLWYQCIHAIGQREPGLRLDSMHALMRQRALLQPETLDKIAQSRRRSIGPDALADHFIACLRGTAQWDFNREDKGRRVVRKTSLRAAVDRAGPAE